MRYHYGASGIKRYINDDLLRCVLMALYKNQILSIYTVMYQLISYYDIFLIELIFAVFCIAFYKF